MVPSQHVIRILLVKLRSQWMQACGGDPRSTFTCENDVLVGKAVQTTVDVW